MKQQRTLNQALQPTTEQRSFINPSLIENEKPVSAGGDSRVADGESDTASLPRVSEPKPAISYNRSPVLVPLTTRLQPQTAEGLRRAYLQQKLKRVSPSTQQEIVEQAIRQWLCNNGFATR